MKLENLVIIGSGCAGLTAAIYASRANLNPCVVEGIQPGGQLTTTSEVENFPGFPNGINGFELTQNMRLQGEKFGARFLAETVISVNLKDKELVVGKENIKARSIIIATGARPRLLGIPGEAQYYGGRGVSTCATCDGAFYKNKEVVVIGGGDSACEEALFLTRFCSKVYIAHRRDQFRASKVMSDRVLVHPKIEVLWNALPQEILGNEKVKEIRLNLAGEDRSIKCDGVFLAIGHVPNTKIFEGQLDLDVDGYIKTNGVETSFAGIFVAGDCCDRKYRQAITSAGMGCAAAISAERFLL